MKKKRSHLILKIFLLLFAVYTIFNLYNLRTKIAAKQDEIKTMNEAIYEQQVLNQQLREAAGTELTDEEIADIARQKLGYALPGERIYIDITGK